MRQALEEFKGQYEESEEIDFIERQFVVRKHHRQKYRCSCNACVETAPGPMKLFPGSPYSIDFAVEVATAKYVDHAPERCSSSRCPSRRDRCAVRAARFPYDSGGPREETLR